MTYEGLQLSKRKSYGKVDAGKEPNGPAGVAVLAVRSTNSAAIIEARSRRAWLGTAPPVAEMEATPLGDELLVGEREQTSKLDALGFSIS